MAYGKDVTGGDGSLPIWPLFTMGVWSFRPGRTGQAGEVGQAPFELPGRGLGMRMNSRMSALIGPELPSVAPGDIPPAYRALLEKGWTTDIDGARLLTALKQGYSGSIAARHQDITHFEATVNGLGMMDYDLPAVGPEREVGLLRRSIAYACFALSLSPSDGDFPLLAYISMSEGGLTEDVLTSHVTFCTRRPAARLYVDHLQEYREEALLELSEDDAVKVFTSHAD